MNILLIEDDENLSSVLSALLEEDGHIVDAAYDGVEGLYFGGKSTYDVIILDVLLPKINGNDVIKMLRNQGVATPTIMLSALSDIRDKVKGLDSGADDYLTKPFAPEELLARLRSMSRRQGEVIVDEVKFSGLILNLSTHTLASSSKSIQLNNKECRMMELFIKSPNIIIPKETLFAKIWGLNSEVNDNTVEAYVSFLRKKLFHIHMNDAIQISTIRSVGYKLEEVSYGN